MASFWGSQTHQKVDFFVTITEIILTVVIVFQIGCELREGGRQDEDLNRMRESIDKLVASTDNLLTATKSLNEQQKESLAFLTDMDAALQTSVKSTRQSTSAMQTQLKILQKDQQDRLTELSKKPLIAAFIGKVPLAPVGKDIPVSGQTATPTNAIFEIVLQNNGTAALLNGVGYVVANSPTVSLSCSCLFEQVSEPKDVAAAFRTIQMPLVRLSKNFSTPGP